MKKIIEEIQKLWYKKYHKKRGFLCTNIDPILTSVHLLEEAVELQAELVYGNNASVLSELVDVYILLAHLIAKLNVSEETVELLALDKLKETFVDQSEILTSNPGFTRANRQ